jgi:hypothetical protein
MNLDPWVSGAADMPVTGLYEVWDDPTAPLTYLTLIYRQSKRATDVTYTVEAGNALDSASWQPATTLLNRYDMGNYWLIIVSDNVPITENPQRFMRLRMAK